jgi:hypothetical protein
MPSLSAHQGSSLIRALYIGDPTTGKTGSLASLVAGGYKLRILDYDNKLSVLAHFVREQCPDKIDNVQAVTVRDKYKSTNTGPIVTQAKAYVDGVKLMNQWEDGSAPAEWGTDTIFVLDSLSAMGVSAFEWAKGMNPGAKDPRQWYITAQQSIQNMVQLLTSESFGPHVIVISHINWKEMQDGTTKGWANAIGSALGPILGRYFNCILLADKAGQGKTLRRVIKTVQTDTIDLITPAPFKIDGELPLDTGLATIFSKLTEVK